MFQILLTYVLPVDSKLVKLILKLLKIPFLYDLSVGWDFCDELVAS